MKLRKKTALFFSFFSDFLSATSQDVKHVLWSCSSKSHYCSGYSFYTSVFSLGRSSNSCPAESLPGGHSHVISHHLRFCPDVEVQSGEQLVTDTWFNIWLFSLS